MAFGLTRNFESALGVNSRLTDNTNNPENLAKLDVENGFDLPDSFLGFDENSADAEIDKVTAMTEARSQGTRVAEAYIELVKADNELLGKLKFLRSLVYRNEMSREQAKQQYESLMHKLQANRRKMGMLLASDVEEENVSVANFRRKLQDRLNRSTNTAKGGTEQGSSYSKVMPFARAR